MCKSRSARLRGNSGAERGPAYPRFATLEGNGARRTGAAAPGRGLSRGSSLGPWGGLIVTLFTIISDITLITVDAVVKTSHISPKQEGEEWISTSMD